MGERSSRTRASTCRRSKNATASRESLRFRCWGIWIGNGASAGAGGPAWCYRKEPPAREPSIVVLRPFSRRFLEIADALADAAADFREAICSENHDDDDQNDDQLGKP